MLSTPKAQQVIGRAAYKSDQKKGNGKWKKYEPDRIYSFKTDRVCPFDDQPRESLDRVYVNQLAASIKKDGQREEGTVSPYYGPKSDRYDVILVDGENRLEACKVAGVDFRAKVTFVEDVDDHYRKSAIANFHRQGHTPIEIGRVVKRFREKYKMTWEEISVDLGMTPMMLQTYESLTKLAPDLQARCGRRVPRSERLSLSIAKRLSELPVDKQHQMAAATRGMSTRKAEITIMNRMQKDGIIPQRSKMGRKPVPSDKIDWIENRLRRALEEYELAMHTDEELLRAGFEKRALGANAATMELLSKASTLIFELKKKMRRCLPKNHLNKMGQEE